LISTTSKGIICYYKKFKNFCTTYGLFLLSFTIFDIKKNKLWNSFGLY